MDCNDTSTDATTRNCLNVRVVAPSRSLSCISRETESTAHSRLATLGFRVSISANARQSDWRDSSSVTARIEDLHAAFLDPSADIILSAIGGYTCNELLSSLDFRLIGSYPKPFCGYSDVTVLLNAINVSTGMVTYHGPHFSSFGMKRGLEYSIEYFCKCLTATEAFDVVPAAQWSDDRWFEDQEARTFYQAGKWDVIRPGFGEGIMRGGNLSSLVLLNATPWQIPLEGTILCVEEIGFSRNMTIQEFGRSLQAISQQKDFPMIRGLLIGRMPRLSNFRIEMLETILSHIKLPKNIPVIANLDFGHTTPQFTFPIGARARINATDISTRLQFLPDRSLLTPKALGIIQ